ncbi:MAG: sulfotransferase [candidate division WOR-3 bacterium]
MKVMKAPIIIIGMHRSGTTMIASMLQQMGVFIGNDLEENLESMFFLTLNEWILRQSGGAWDNPNAGRWFLNRSEIFQLVYEYIKDRVYGFPIISYLGWKRFIKYKGNLNNMREPWGWKDPRNTITLPLWLKLYPDAKVIHIYRNGVAVAVSLYKRECEHLKIAKAKHIKRKTFGLYKFIPKKGGFVWSSRCLSLEDAFTLWEEYTEMALKMMETVKEQGFTIKYEDFLNKPVSILSELRDFCELNCSNEFIDKLAFQVKPERANAYKKLPELMICFERISNSPLMQKLGYSQQENILGHDK